MRFLGAAATCFALSIANALLPASAFGADAPPTAEQIRFAAQEHDLGYRAYVARGYEEAATHFENAFFAASNPAELRSAIRARRDAGHRARAATLAAIAKRKYADDAATAKAADDAIADARPHTFEVLVTSPVECSVAVDRRIVLEQKLRSLSFFVDPGRHEVVVSWSDDRTRAVSIDARAGASQTLALAPPPPPPARISTPAPAPALVPIATSTEARPFPPAVFLAGAALTAVGAAATLWSGLDAKNNPGADAVRRDCVGQGDGCPEYQQGLSAQRRTNILLAATGGAAVLTGVVGLFFTQWSHAPVTPQIGAGTVGLAGALP